MKKSILPCLFAPALLLGVSLSGNEEVDTEAVSELLSSYSGSIVSLGSGKLGVDYTVTARSQMDELGAIVITLSQSANKSDWSVVKTFRLADYSAMVKKNSRSYTYQVKYTGKSNYYYKAIISFYAKDGTTSQTRSYNTAVKKIS